MPDLSLLKSVIPAAQTVLEWEVRYPPGFMSFPILGLGKSVELLYQMNKYSQRCFLRMF